MGITSPLHRMCGFAGGASFQNSSVIKQLRPVCYCISHISGRKIDVLKPGDAPESLATSVFEALVTQDI